MLPRIWVVLLTMLLVAAQVHAEIELGDTTAEHADDEVVALVAISIATPHERTCTLAPTSRARPAPLPARIFRPPRRVSIT